MKKFAISVITVMCILSSFAPMTQVDACTSSHQSLNHFYSAGHTTGSLFGGSHFTTYQVNGGRAWAQILLSDTQLRIGATIAGRAATAQLPAGVLAWHRHASGVN